MERGELTSADCSLILATAAWCGRGCGQERGGLQKARCQTQGGDKLTSGDRVGLDQPRYNAITCRPATQKKSHPPIRLARASPADMSNRRQAASRPSTRHQHQPSSHAPSTPSPPSSPGHVVSSSLKTRTVRADRSRSTLLRLPNELLERINRHPPKGGSSPSRYMRQHMFVRWTHKASDKNILPVIVECVPRLQHLDLHEVSPSTLPLPCGCGCTRSWTMPHLSEAGIPRSLANAYRKPVTTAFPFTM